MSRIASIVVAALLLATAAAPRCAAAMPGSAGGLAAPHPFPAELPEAESGGGMAVPPSSVVKPPESDAAESDSNCRPYAAKVLGLTFANIHASAVMPAHAGTAFPPAWNGSASSSGTLFTGGLAGGVRIPRDFGAARLECEGILRDNFNGVSHAAHETAVDVQSKDNWTVLANVWRDVPLTRRLGAYAGGGVGGGGYCLDVAGPDGSSASARQGVFAWQAGAGAVWRYNSLIDLDMSYRFLDFGHIDAVMHRPGDGAIGTVSSKTTAGELLFMLRVYEPFQWWTHLRSREFYLPE